MFVLSKTKCVNCCRKSTMNQNCKYCEEIFCLNCVQQEIHKCEKLEHMVKEKQALLFNKLHKEKCIGSKIQKI